MQSFCPIASWIILLVLCLANLTGCGTVKSLVPGMGTEQPAGLAAGEKLHLKVTPEEAIVILQDIAPQAGWQMVSAGDQRDLQGLRGKYFVLETEKFIGGLQSISGVFFSEPAGSYVLVGKRNTGLPEALAAPLTAAVEARQGAAATP
jgi:hypothetical protein